jgi:hypothetical protein
MPNHIHLIVVPETTDAQRLQSVKPIGATPGGSIFVRAGAGIYGREGSHH